jgi:hypothetical protein
MQLMTTVLLPIIRTLNRKHAHTNNATNTVVVNIMINIIMSTMKLMPMVTMMMMTTMMSQGLPQVVVGGDVGAVQGDRRLRQRLLRGSPVLRATRGPACEAREEGHLTTRHLTTGIKHRDIRQPDLSPRGSCNSL